MKQRWFVLLLLLIFLLPQMALAQTSLYDGVDILFLIDQSGSMGRVKGGVRPNDALGLRFASPRYVTDLMGEFVLAINPDISFRMGIVSFGETAERWNFASPGADPLYWKVINPASRAQWEPDYKSLLGSFDAMEKKYTQDDLSGTDFQVAFRAAKSMFDSLPPMSGNRLRIIIILTDGQPSEGVATHMANLRSYAKNNFPTPGYRIYTIGMIDAADTYWQNVEPYWESITSDPCTAVSCPDPLKDRTSLVASNDEVGKRFQEIFLEFSGELDSGGASYVDKEITPGNHIVPPFVSSISFAYFKTERSQELIVKDPLGRTVDENFPDADILGKDKPIQVLRVLNPLPGTWEVNTNPPGAGVSITMRYIYAKSRLDSPAGTQVQYVPVKVQYAILDENNQPLPVYSDPQYALTVEAVVSAGEQFWNLFLKSGTDNTYAADFIPVLVGPHTITVKAASRDANTKEVVIFDGPIGSFDVSPVLIQPKNLPLLWPQYSEQPITFELTNASGAPIAQKPDTLQIVASVSGAQNVELPLVLQSDGTYQALYTPNTTGEHIVHVLASVIDSAGVKQVILDSDVGSFDVSPTVRVEMKVLQPGSAAQFDTELLPFNRNPLVLQIKLADENGRALDPQRIFAGNPASALTVTKIQDSKGNPISDVTLTMQQTPELGVYLAETTELGIGNYVITVQADALQSGYIYKRDSVDVSVARIRHPLHIPLLIAGILLLAGMIATTSWLVIRDKNLRKHPCRGVLRIADAHGTIKHTIRLDSYGKNDIWISGKELPVLTHIQKMRVRSQSASDSSNGRVLVEIWLDRDKTPAVNRSMSPGSEAKIGKYPFWLSKDMDDIPEHPEEQLEL